jgi:hypothetical protein
MRVAVLVLSLLVGACSAQNVVTGVVVDPTGKPVAGVKVEGEREISDDPRGCCHTSPISTTSDEQGNFTLEAPGKFVRIFDWKLRPAIVYLKEAGHPVRLVAEPFTSGAVNMPECRKQYGAPLFAQYTLPKHAKIKRGADTDYWYFTLYAPRSSDHLVFHQGAMWGGYSVEPGEIEDAANFQQRAIVNAEGHAVGRDTTARLKNGEFFRDFGLYREEAAYIAHSKESADYFDAFIATICEPRLPE